MDVSANNARNKLDYDTYALFGQTNYQFAPQWDVTLGVRASYLKVNSDFNGNPAWFINPYNKEQTESTVSPKAAIGWQANEDTRLYASITSGYRPGGYNVVPLSNADASGYDAEKSLNGELGWRTNFANQKSILVAHCTGLKRMIFNYIPVLQGIKLLKIWVRL